MTLVCFNIIHYFYLRLKRRGFFKLENSSLENAGRSIRDLIAPAVDNSLFTSSSLTFSMILKLLLYP